MVDLTWHDYAQPSSSVRPNPLDQVADVAVDAVCNLYYRTPAAFLSNDGGGGAILSAQRAFMDNACAPKHQLPPAPVPPFSGGQCQLVKYGVHISFTEKYIEQQEIKSRSNTASQEVFGAVGSVTITDSGSYTSQGKTISGGASVSVACQGLSYQPPHASVVRIYGFSSESGLRVQSIDNINIVRIDNQPDNCGDPPPVYPPNTVTNNDFHTNNNITISPDVQVSVPITIIPTFAPITNIFRPELNIDVGGINVNLSLGGITFAPSVSLPVNVGFPTPIDNSNPVTPKPIVPPSSGGGSATDLEPTNKKIDDLKKRVEDCCDELSPHTKPSIDVTVISRLGEGRSGNYPLPPKTYQVNVLITQHDNNVKRQNGVDAPGVVYAGWAWFGSGVSLAERQPIDALNKVFPVPTRVDGFFAFTMPLGFSAIIQAYSIKPITE